MGYLPRHHQRSNMRMSQSSNLNGTYLPQLKLSHELSCDLSHELRTLSTVIQVAMELLSCGKLGTLSPQEKQMVDMAAKNAERLMRLTQAIEGDAEAKTSFLSAEDFAQLKLEQDLKQALIHNELYLCYQPIVSINNNQVLGFETLIRWQHPTRGNLSPDQFIPLAEKSDLIIDIDLWVLQTACYQLNKWQNQCGHEFDDITVSVNISSKHLAHPDFYQQIEQILQQTGLPSRNLVLEITESAIVDNVVNAKNTLDKLQNLGVRLYIDDFGTGYSSLSRLYDMPFDLLKIDRSFVQKLNYPAGENLVKTITNMAKNLGIDVIAEGVETVEQSLKLQLLGCNKVQGYLFAKPLDSELVTEFMLQSKTNCLLTA
jgi:EAL domain-containing protein (putative c-di-GMP-specific phosphodiesterase class I)